MQALHVLTNAATCQVRRLQCWWAHSDRAVSRCRTAHKDEATCAVHLDCSAEALSFQNSYGESKNGAETVVVASLQDCHSVTESARMFLIGHKHNVEVKSRPLA